MILRHSAPCVAARHSGVPSFATPRSYDVVVRASPFPTAPCCLGNYDPIRAGFPSCPLVPRRPSADVFGLSRDVATPLHSTGVSRMPDCKGSGLDGARVNCGGRGKQEKKSPRRPPAMARIRHVPFRGHRHGRPQAMDCYAQAILRVCLCARSTCRIKRRMRSGLEERGCSNLRGGGGRWQRAEAAAWTLMLHRPGWLCFSVGSRHGRARRGLHGRAGSSGGIINGPGGRGSISRAPFSIYLGHVFAVPNAPDENGQSSDRLIAPAINAMHGSTYRLVP